MAIHLLDDKPSAAAGIDLLQENTDLEKHRMILNKGEPEKYSTGTIGTFAKKA